MKNIIPISLTILLFTIISCQKEKISNTAPEEIKITGAMTTDESLKTALINPTVNWLAGADKIGVFSDRAYVTVPGDNAVNIAYTAQSTAPVSNFTGAVPIYWDGTSNVHNFYAYYPYLAEASLISEIPISLPFIQSQVGTSTTHLGSLDFEVATPLALTPTTPKPVAAYSFNHIFTILKFDLTCSTENLMLSIKVSTNDLPAISLYTGSTIDITQSTPPAGVPFDMTSAPGGLPSQVTLYTNLIVSGTPSSAYMIILPGDATGNTFTIEFTAASGKIYSMTKDGINFDRGKIYTITQAIPVGGPNGW